MATMALLFIYLAVIMIIIYNNLWFIINNIDLVFIIFLLKHWDYDMIQEKNMLFI